MLRKVLYILLLTALLAGFTFTPAQAQGTGPASYYSTFQIQNLSTTTAATISIVFYDQNGTAVTTLPDTVPAGGSKTYTELTQLSPGFKGSVVISSNQPVASISNLVGNNASGQAISLASYSAFTAGSTSVSIPLLFKNNFGFNTFFSVQNTGTSDANITVTYSDGTTASRNGVKPGASATFDQATETHSQAVFSAVVSGGTLAATVVEYNATTLFSFGGFSAASAATNPVMPLINANNFGFVTGVQIQNPGSAATTVTVNYIPSQAGTACQEVRTVPAGGSNTFALYVFGSGDPNPSSLVSTNCVRGQTFVGSAQVTSTSPSQAVVAVVNQLNSAQNKGAAYNAFNPASGKARIVFPLIMDRNFGYFTGWGIANVGTATIPAGALTCTVVGTDRTGATVTRTFTNPADVAVGGSWTHVQLNQIADRFVGSASCSTTTAGASLVGTVNELGGGTIDSFLVYEGFPTD